MAFVALFGETLLNHDGNIKTADLVAGKKHVLVYFSAHWCPPCRGFTPQLAQAYNESVIACDNTDVAIIFVSSDKDEAAFKEYYGEMPWHALPFAERDLKDKISTQFGVKGIPMLVVLNAEAKLVTDQGRGQYKTYLPGGEAAADLRQTAKRQPSETAPPSLEGLQDEHVFCRNKGDSTWSTGLVTSSVTGLGTDLKVKRPQDWKRHEFDEVKKIESGMRVQVEYEGAWIMGTVTGLSEEVTGLAHKHKQVEVLCDVDRDAGSKDRLYTHEVKFGELR